MQKRTTVLGGALSVGLVMGVLTMASGCVSDAENEEASEKQETVSQALNTQAACTYAANGPGGVREAQRRAEKALRYVMGANNVGEQLCSASTKAYLDTVRSAITDGVLNVTSSTQSMLCSVTYTRVRLTQQNLTSTKNQGPLWDAFYALAQSGGGLDSCFGQGASTFFVVQMNATSEGGMYRNFVDLDPEPAQLSASLDVGSSASAAAMFTNSNAPTRAYRFGALPSPCGAAIGGSPCTTSTSFLPAGTTLNKSLIQSGDLCRCSGSN